MSCEPKRGCGYRKIGGTYLVSGPEGFSCDRLPFKLCICPVCGQGVKFSRGWTWVDIGKLVGGPHLLKDGVSAFHLLKDGISAFPDGIICKCPLCPLCVAPQTMGRGGLLWVGARFYPKPEHFMAEGLSLGFSRRIASIPRGFKLGSTWVLMAHKKGFLEMVKEPINPEQPELVPIEKVKYSPGVFTVWRPTKIERILPDTEQGNEELLEKLAKKNITPVFVDANDPDHQGSVWDEKKQTELIPA